VANEPVCDACHSKPSAFEGRAPRYNDNHVDTEQTSQTMYDMEVCARTRLTEQQSKSQREETKRRLRYFIERQRPSQGTFTTQREAIRRCESPIDHSTMSRQLSRVCRTNFVLTRTEMSKIETVGTDRAALHHMVCTKHEASQEMRIIDARAADHQRSVIVHETHAVSN